MLSAESSTHSFDEAVVSDSPPTDARPILRRSATNVWERIEQRRSELQLAMERECMRQGVEALTLQSDPYVHPAWVTFECWMPKEKPEITARSSAKITITAMPYHSFEAVYKVEWEQYGARGEINDLYQFGDVQMSQLIQELCSSPPTNALALLRSRHIRTFLRPVQLRQTWWHIWEPKNKVEVLRRDRLATASGVLLALGALMLASSLASDSGALANLRPPPVFMPFGSSVAFAVAEAAQVTPARTPDARALTRDSEVSSVLSDASPKREGAIPFELWSYLADAGEHFVVTMRSDAFDSLLIVGVGNEGTFTALDQNDDFAGQPHAQIRFSASESREYLIVASSYAAPAAGGYTLQVAEAEALPALSPSPGNGLESGQLSPFTPSDTANRNNAGGVWGVLFMITGVVGLVICARAPRLVRSSGKPTAEPRILYSLDSWQTVMFGVGADVDTIRQRLLAHFTATPQQRFALALERVWHWGIDGKIEREQIVLRYGRALVFCQVHSYGADLYVGWDAKMNLGAWLEKKLASGVDVETGDRVRLMTVEHAVQATTDYDLIDLNCLAEWTHAQIVQVLKQFLRERQIDQEIDFSIIRGERKGLSSDDKNENSDRRKKFLRKS